MNPRRTRLGTRLLIALCLTSCVSCASMRPSGGSNFDAPRMKGEVKVVKCQTSLTPSASETKPEEKTDAQCVVLLLDDFRGILRSLIVTCVKAGFSPEDCGVK